MHGDQPVTWRPPFAAMASPNWPPHGNPQPVLGDPILATQTATPTRPMATILVSHINSTWPARLLFLPPNLRPHLLSTPLIWLEKHQRSNLYPLLSHGTRTTPYMGTLISPFMVADQQPWRPCPAPSRWRPAPPQVTTSLPFPWRIHVWPATPPMATPTCSPLGFQTCVPPRRSVLALQGDSIRPASPSGAIPTSSTSTPHHGRKHGVVAAGKQQDVLLVFFFPCWFLI